LDGIILAAGIGKRLHPLTLETPKPLIPVGDRALTEHVLLGLKSAGVSRVGLVIGYMADRVEAHFGDGSAFGVEIVIQRQETTDGTARAMLLLRDFIESDPFLLTYGDVILADAENYGRLIAFHRDGGFDLSIACNRVDDPFEGAAVTLEGDRVVSIVEKPPKGTSATDLNSRGVYVFPRSIVDLAERIPPSSRGEYEITSVIEAAMEAGMRVGGYVATGFTSDVGTHERLAEAREVFGTIQREGG